MKELINVKRTTFNDAESFFDYLKETGKTSFGGWKNIVFYALSVAFTTYGHEVKLRRNKWGYSFEGLPETDLRSQEPNQLMNRYVRAGLLALDDENPESVYEFSEAWTLFKVRHRQSKKQSGEFRTSERIKKGITEIINSLAEKGKDSTAKELWDKFTGEIHLLVEGQNEGKLYADYLDEDGREARITYKTFSNKLSAARKNLG